MRLSNEIGGVSEDLRRLSAIVISLQKDAQNQAPQSVVGVTMPAPKVSKRQS